MQIFSGADFDPRDLVHFGEDKPLVLFPVDCLNGQLFELYLVTAVEEPVCFFNRFRYVAGNGFEKALQTSRCLLKRRKLRVAVSLKYRQSNAVIGAYLVIYTAHIKGFWKITYHLSCLT